MRHKVDKYLYDIRESARLLVDFANGRSFDEYQENAMLRAAVERQFEIIGGAVSQLAKLDEETASRISEFRRIISFRNILVHGYAEIDDGLVWDIVIHHLPKLAHEIEELIRD